METEKVKGNRVKVPSDPVTVSGYPRAYAIAERREGALGVIPQVRKPAWMER